MIDEVEGLVRHVKDAESRLGELATEADRVRTERREAMRDLVGLVTLPGAARLLGSTPRSVSQVIRRIQ